MISALWIIWEPEWWWKVPKGPTGIYPPKIIYPKSDHFMQHKFYVQISKFHTESKGDSFLFLQFECHICQVAEENLELA